MNRLLQIHSGWTLQPMTHWLRLCPLQLQQKVEDAWGPAPGELFVDARRSGHPEIFFAGLELGNVLVMVQPPRGFGENPVSIYHDPELAPSHHYLAAYWWLAADRTVGGWGAHAIVHVGKHGNLEWLPGKQNALSPSCGPDAALRDLPVIYPFLINDPGEGTQAKRRAHAVLVDRLLPYSACGILWRHCSTGATTGRTREH
ncbi:MAG: cobaltochelatase subunit CobN [Lawsonella clevelandensis]